MDTQNLSDCIRPVVEGMGYIYWGAGFSAGRRRASLRVFIDHADGVTLDDCTAVSHQLSGVLDVENAVSGPYVLEVSSPGVERRLMNIEHYRQYTGSRISVKSDTPIEGRKNFTGLLARVTERAVVVQTDDGAVEVPLGAVRRARLVADASQTRGRG